MLARSAYIQVSSPLNDSMLEQSHLTEGLRHQDDRSMDTPVLGDDYEGVGY